MKSIVFHAIASISLLVGVLAIIIGLVGVPIFVDRGIANKVTIATSAQYRRWEKVPYPLSFKVYFFNVDNPEDILNGAKPKVTEKGPYVYKLFIQKSNINYDEATQSYDYYINQKYVFDEEASLGKLETDKVTVLNAPKYAAFIEAVEEGQTFLLNNDSINLVFPGAENSLFFEITVADYLFEGYNFCMNPFELCNLVRPNTKTIPNVEVLEDGSFSFSFFKHKMSYPDGPYTINSGITDALQTGQISKYKNIEYLDVWIGKQSECNKIVGTDGTIYPPYNNKQTILEVFNADICRSVKLQFLEEITYKGVKTYRSRIDQNVFASPKSYPQNTCFSTKATQPLFGNDCFPDGFLDLKTCLKAPIVASHPHLLWADQIYKNTISGLSPDVGKHSTFVDLEPDTGLLLRGSNRLQFNMMFQKLEGVNILEKIQPSVLPIFWLDEGTELSDALLQKLKEDYINKQPRILGAKWGIFSVGVFFIFVCVCLYLWKFISSHRKKNNRK